MTRDGLDGVVAKIKAVPAEVHLLVADSETYEHFKQSDERSVSETKLFIEVIAGPDDALDTGQVSAGRIGRC